MRSNAVVIGMACVLALPSLAFAADTVAPSVPGNLVVTVASNTQLNVSWDAATDNVAVTGYLIERCNGTGCTNFAQIVSVTSTTYNNTALTVATSYSYRLRARDAANNKSAYSAIVSATTLPDTQPPTAPAGLGITVSSATQLNLSWTAATDDIKVVGYLVERCLGAGCTTFSQVAAPTTTTYTSTGLTPASSYSYRVRAKDASNNLGAYSTVVSATTLPDTQAPTAPTSATATVVSNTSIKVTWTASTDDVKVTGYKIERCGGVGCTNFVQVATSTSVTYTNSSLIQGSSYSYRIRANDAAGNVSGYSNVTTTTTTGTDTQVPSTPTGLTATPTSSTQINLTWTASTDNVGVTGYRVERCQGTGCSTFAQIATPTGSTYSDSGLMGSTSYSYRVRATDAANNLSGYSSTATATTPVPPDTQAPTAPSAFTATAASMTQINLSWTASTDDVGVTAYLVERCQGASCSTYTQIASVSSTTYNNTSLTASTAYSYRVRATDAANNLSSYSSTATATTQSPAPVTFTYTYDSLGRLTKASGSDGSVIDYQYDANGNATTIKHH